MIYLFDQFFIWMLIFVVIKQKGWRSGVQATPLLYLSSFRHCTKRNYSIFFCQGHKIPQKIEINLISWPRRKLGRPGTWEPTLFSLSVTKTNLFASVLACDQICLIAYTMRKNVQSIKTNLSILSSPSSWGPCNKMPKAFAEKVLKRPSLRKTKFPPIQFPS